MKMHPLKGFTIVELLIVIAIIAILTAVVLVNVIAYINAGKDSSIRANLSSIMTNASVFYDQNDTFTGFCGDIKYTAPSDAIAGITDISQSCNIEPLGTTWCACASLKTVPTDVFCVDSTGTKKTVSASDCLVECGPTAVCL